MTTKKKRVTLSDIGRAAGVSTSAVSMILNDRRDVSFNSETVEKVRQVAETLGYKAPFHHRKPLFFQKKTVVIVTPNVSNGYYTTLLQAVQQAAVEKDFATLCYTTYRDPAREAELLAMVEAIGAVGVIFCMMPADTALVERFNQNIPCVVIGDRRTNLSVDAVEIDNYRAGFLVGSHLLGLGHRQLAFVSTTLNEKNEMRLARLQGVRDACASEGQGCSVTVLAENVTPAEELNEFDVEHRVGHSLTVRLLKRRTAVTGIVAVNDSVAYGVLDALHEAKIRVPEDMSVCGFDNLFSMRNGFLRLTTVDHHIEDKGHSAFNMLYERIRGANTASNNITRVEFTHYLVKGHTSGPAPERPVPEQGLQTDRSAEKDVDAGTDQQMVAQKNDGAEQGSAITRN